MPSVGGLLSGPELAGTGQEPYRQVSFHSRTPCPTHTSPKSPISTGRTNTPLEKLPNSILGREE